MLALCLFLGFVSAEQLTPIPNKVQEGFLLSEPAFRAGKPAEYTLEVYYDHLCSDSANAYPGLIKYWKANADWLDLVIHIFPLPYHYNAFWVAQAGRFIQESYPSQFLNFISYIFKHQNTYLTDAKTWTFSQIMQKLSNDTSIATKVPASQVSAALNDSDINWSTRVSWKFAASNEITGTPQYFVNGVSVPDVANYENPSQWKKFFKTLKSCIPSNKKMQSELNESPDLKASFHAENMAEVIPMLKEQQRKAIEEGNLMEAEAIKQKIISLLRRQKELESSELEAKQKADRECVEAAHLDRFNQLNADWDDNLKKYTSESELTLQKLAEKHSIERKTLLDSLETSVPKTPKPSSKVLDLQRKKDVHIRAEEFKEAHQIHLLLEALERKEQEKWEKERSEIIGKQLKNIEDRHATELAGLKAKMKSEYDEMKRDRAVEMETLIKRYQNDLKQIESLHKVEKNKQDGRTTNTSLRSSLQTTSISRILSSSKIGTPSNSFRVRRSKQ